MALSFNPLIYVNPTMSMGSLNTHAQAVGGSEGPERSELNRDTKAGCKDSLHI